MSGTGTGSQAYAFLHALFKPSDYIELRDIRKDADNHPHTVFHGRVDTLTEEYLDTLEDTETCFSVNPREATVARKPAGYSRLVLLDLDDAPKPSNNPRDAAPSAIVLSGGPGKRHYYWSINETISFSKAEFIQRILAAVYDGDTKVIESARVMRLPGVRNCKPEYGPDARSSLELLDTDATYSVEDVEAFAWASLLRTIVRKGDKHNTLVHFTGYCALTGMTDEIPKRALTMLHDMGVIADLQGKLGPLDRAYQRRRDNQSIAFNEFWSKLPKPLITIIKDHYPIAALQDDIFYNGAIIGSGAGKDIVDKTIREAFVSLHDHVYYGSTLMEYKEDAGWVQPPPTRDALHTALTTFISGCVHVRAQGSNPIILGSQAIRSVLGHVKNMLPVHTGDTEPHCIGFTNGYYDLEQDSFFPHTRDKKIFHTTGYAYDEDATCPLWDDFVHYVSDNDDEMYDFLTRYSGYILTSANTRQHILWLMGPSGTGKSTYIKVHSDVLGGYARPFSAMPGSMANNNYQYMIAHIDGARLLVQSELTRTIVQADLLKQVVSGDSMTGRRAHADFSSVKVQAHVMLASNQVPHFDEMAGMDRRLLPVHFGRKVAADPTYETRLRAELPGIFNRFQRARHSPYKVPDKVISRVNAMVADHDIYGQFVTMMLVEDATASIPKHHLAELWKEYLVICNIRTNSQMYATQSLIRGMMEMGATFAEGDKLTGYRPKRIGVTVGGTTYGQN